MQEMTIGSHARPKATAEPADRRPALRWGARAVIAAPILAVFSVAVGIPVFADDMADVAGTARWVLVTGSALVVLILLALGLVALYLAQEHRFGAFGHGSALVALAGTMLAAGGAWDSVFTVPYLAEYAPEVLERSTSGSLLAGYVSSYFVLALGWAAFAVATLRAKLLPRGAAITLLAGAVLAILPAPTALRLFVLLIGAALLARAATRPR